MRLNAHFQSRHRNGLCSGQVLETGEHRILENFGTHLCVCVCVCVCVRISARTPLNKKVSARHIRTR